MIEDYAQMQSIVAALRKQASEHGGALHLDRHLTGILLGALERLAQPYRHAPVITAIATAVARGDVISLADARMVRKWAADDGPEGAA